MSEKIKKETLSRYAPTPPSSNDVCKALSEYYKKTLQKNRRVYYKEKTFKSINHNWVETFQEFWYKSETQEGDKDLFSDKHPQKICSLFKTVGMKEKKVFFNEHLPPRLTKLISLFYETCDNI